MIEDPIAEISVEPILLFDDKSFYSKLGSTDISDHGSTITGAIYNSPIMLKHVANLDSVAAYTWFVNSSPRYYITNYLIKISTHYEEFNPLSTTRWSDRIELSFDAQFANFELVIYYIYSKYAPTDNNQ